MPAFGIDADDDAPGEFLRGLAHEGGVFGRRTAEDDAVDPGAEPGFDLAKIADAAAELHRNGDGGQNGPHRIGVYRFAGERAVKVHDMHPAEARLLPGGSLRARVLAVHGRAVHLAALQAHAGAVFKVDRGVKGQVHLRCL